MMLFCLFLHGQHWLLGSPFSNCCNSLAKGPFLVKLSLFNLIQTTLYSGPSTKWTSEDISCAITEIRNGLSYRKAERKYGIPKSTLHLYAIGKIELGSRPGPRSILTTAEEEQLVQYVVEMSRIVQSNRSKTWCKLLSKRIIVPILSPTIDLVKNGGSYLKSDTQYFP